MSPGPFNTLPLSSISDSNIEPHVLTEVPADPTAGPSTTTANHILSSDPELASIQRQAMQILEERYGQERVGLHIWTWSDNRWIPSYWRQNIAGCKSVREIWDEYEVGVNGHLSLSELEEGWRAAWRQGDRGASADLSRRGRVISLVKEISQKRNWTNGQALDFLRVQFPIYNTSPDTRLRTVRSFIEALSQKGPFRAHILEACLPYNPI